MYIGMEVNKYFKYFIYNFKNMYIYKYVYIYLYNTLYFVSLVVYKTIFVLGD